MVAIDEKLKRMPRTVRVGIVAGGLSEFIDIQAAIDWCSTQAVPAPAAGARYTVEAWPGTHAGPIVMADYVDVIAQGTREDTIITRTPGADDLPTVTGALADLKGFTVISDGNGNADRSRCLNNATDGFRFLDCEFIATAPAVNAIVVLNTHDMHGYRTPIDILQAATEALNLNDGVTYLEDVDLGGGTYSVNMHTAATNLHIRRGSMVADVITAGAVIQTLTIDYCDLNGATFTLGATGACVYSIERCTRAGPITDASLLGTGTIDNTDVAGAGLVKNGTTPWTIWRSFLTSADNANAVGAITIYGGQLHGCADATGVVLWLIPGLGEYKVIEGMDIAHALAAMAAGDVIRIGPGLYALTAQLARAIDDVTIKGVRGVRITLDGVTPVITAGVQDGWVITDIDVDAGLVEIQFATNSTLHNITINGLHATITNPDVGQTNFPGQPTLRLEEIRALNPAVSDIIKVFDKIEYQAQNPTFANPQFIMELLRRQGRYMHVPINDLWTDGSTGGTTLLYPQYAELTCAAVAGRDALVYCVAPFLNSYVDATVWDRTDFDNIFIWAFDVSRDAGTHADLRARVQLKQAIAEGVLANDGMGIQIQNYDIFGEAFAAAQGTVDLGVTMVAELSYRIAIVLIPNVSVDFYVNEVYRGQITAQVPSGPAAGTCYWVLSMDNAAQAVACILRVSPISYWNHL